jgi:hypothetical protein
MYSYLPGPPEAAARGTMWRGGFEAVLEVFTGDFGSRQEAASQVLLFVTDGLPSAEAEASVAVAQFLRDLGATIITVQVTAVLGNVAGDDDDNPCFVLCALCFVLSNCVCGTEACPHSHRVPTDIRRECSPAWIVNLSLTRP